jgi:hypothetical protein
VVAEIRDDRSALENIYSIVEAFSCGRATPAGEALNNVRACLDRGLPEVDHVSKVIGPSPVSLMGGGPSLGDTWRTARGKLFAANGSLGFLLDRGIVPQACVVLEAVPWVADDIPVRSDVEYYLASRCSPQLFDRLDGMNVTVFHIAGQDDPTEILDERRARTGRHDLIIRGGSTVMLRAIPLAFALGHRVFDIHAMDSSFRPGQTHAYKDRLDNYGESVNQMWIAGYPTCLVFMEQVIEFLIVADTFEKRGCTFHVHGDGLLQHCWREHVDQRSAVA